MRLTEEVADFLEEKGLGTVGTNIFISYVLDSPDDAIFILDTGGYPSDVDVPIDNPTVQIRVRNTSYPDCYDLAWRIYDLLNRATEYYLGEIRVLFSYALQPPIYLGWDAKNRVEYSLNFYFHIIR